MIFKEDGQLTEKAKEDITKRFTKLGVSWRKCCDKPQLVVPGLVLAIPAIKMEGQPHMDMSSGSPVVVVGCTRCGALYHHLLAFALPNWKEK